jgi:hypothetical protein
LKVARRSEALNNGIDRFFFFGIIIDFRELEEKAGKNRRVRTIFTSFSLLYPADRKV